MQKNKNLQKCMLLLLLLVSIVKLNAQETEENDSEEKEKATTTFTASVETHYAHNFSGVDGTATIPAYRDNRFELGWMNLGILHEGKNYGLEVILAAGTKADANYRNAFYEDEESIYKYIRSANAYFNPTDDLKFTVGLVQPFYGYEYDDGHLNQNYTTGYNYAMVSQGFAGAQLDYTISDSWSAMVGVYNNLYQRQESNDNKLLALNLAYAGDSFEAMGSFLTSKEPDGITVNVLDLTGLLILSDTFLIGYQVQNLSFDDGEGFEGNVLGASLFPLITLSDTSSIGVRGEIFQDKDGYFLGVEDNTMYNVTLSYNHTVGNFKITPEIRLDGSSEEFFITGNGNPSKDDSFALIGITYMF